MQKQAKVMARKTSFPVLYRNVFFSKTGQNIGTTFWSGNFIFLQNGGEKKFHCFMTSFQEFKSHDDFCSKWHFAYSPTCLLAKCPSDWLAPKINVKNEFLPSSEAALESLNQILWNDLVNCLCHQSLKKLQKYWYIVIDWLNKDYCT